MKAKKTIVVGAGFSGLSLSYWLLKQGHEVELYEASHRVGGLLNSQRLAGGHLVESAANGFLFQPEFEMLEKDLGLRFIPTLKLSRKRYFFRKSIRRWPLGIWESIVAFVKLVSSLFEWAPRKKESIRQWAHRVVGASASKYVVETGLQGIYAGRAEDMSASLILGPYLDPVKKKQQSQFVRSSFSGKARWGTHTHPEGMGTLVQDWFAYLQKQDRFHSYMGQEVSMKDLEVKRRAGAKIFVCTPPYKAAEFFQETHPHLSRKLASLEILPILSATLIFDKASGEKAMPQGFGILFARDEGFDVLGVLRNHCIFPGRSDQVSETWIYSGASLQKKGLWKKEEACLRFLLEERERLTGQYLQPLFYHFEFWDRALPHYTFHLEDFLESQELKDLRQEGVQLFGNYTGQIGLARLFLAAKKIAETL
jgi:oxygen-dependent protoporphyrinogen oxidase